METATKRNYTRRTDEDRISELAAKLERIKTRVEMRKQKDSPVMREIAKVQRTLRKFAQTAQDHGREDLAISTMAFAAGLDRAATTRPDDNRGRGRASRDLE